MTRKAQIYYNSKLTGILSKEEDKYYFRYDNDYLQDPTNPAVSLSLPKRKEPFISNVLFPFFYGLLAEGDNKEIQCRILKIDENDHFTRLLRTAELDTIGGITVKEI